MAEFFEGTTSADWIQAGLTIAYVVATILILRANTRAVRAMAEQTDAVLRPLMVIRAECAPGTPLLRLCVENLGRTPAHELRLELDQDFHRFGESDPSQNIRKFAAFSEPIKSFPPGMHLLFNLAAGPALYAKDARLELTPLVFKVRARYTWTSDYRSWSAQGRREADEITTIDLRPFVSSRYDSNDLRDGLAKIADALRQLNQSVVNFESHRDRPC